MANIKSIGGNPIVLGLDGLSDEVTHGYNPSLSVGRADALTGADSTAQWAQRESTGSGTATVRSVQGAAVGWNQSVNAGTTTQTGYGITLVPSQDTSWVVSGTVSDSPAMPYIDVNTWSAAKRADAFTPNHKYLIKVYDTVCTPTERFAYLVITGNGIGYAEISASNQRILTPTDVPSGVYIRARIDGYKGTTVSGTVAWNIFDLTAMFGSGNEPATVEEFERMYPASYYPYSAPTLKPVQIAGIRSTDAQGGELDAIEWTAQTLRAAGSVRDMLYSDHVDVNVGVVDLGARNWSYNSTYDCFTTNLALLSAPAATSFKASCAAYPYIGSYAFLTDKTLGYIYNTYVAVRDSTYTTEADFKAAMSGVLLFYQLATPTTTPISPALPMTYRVEQSGSESIIVPDGEISAAPILTVAEGESAATLVMDALAAIAAPDGPVATANHAINTYLTMQGKLYKVTSAIAVGESITPNTNVTETTVMAELIARTA